MRKKFQLKSGTVLPIRADIAAREIERIKNKNGGLSPAIVVKEAWRKKSPIHNCFEWNNIKAAKKYRLRQAGYLIRAIEVVYIDDENKKTQPVRAFVTLVEDDIHTERSYHTIAEVLNDKDLRKQYLKQLLWEYESLMKRNADVVEFAAIHDSIKKTKKKMK